MMRNWSWLLISVAGIAAAEPPPRVELVFTLTRNGSVMAEVTEQLQYAGGNNASTNCTQVIGDTVSFVGNSLLKINCAGSGTKPIGVSVASLVE